MAFLAFSLMTILAVLLIGMLLGARFSASPTSLAQSVGFLFLPILAASGIGLIIGTLISSEQGAVYSGIGIALITAFISGIFNLYRNLPGVLQVFSRIYPISSSNYSLVYLLIGEKMAGYNPLELSQMGLTITSSVALFGAGLAIYTKFSWRKE
jgi:ABC-type polysaccharide/polyol phosphate export permease